MAIDLIASTDVATCVVFDPASVEHLRALEWDAFGSVGEDREADAGNLVLLQTGADGTSKLRLYVEEEPPPELVKRAFHEAHNRLLRVPSGVLQASGAEHLPFKDAIRSTATSTTVPAGDYRVDAYLIEPDERDLRKTTASNVIEWGSPGSVVLAPIALLFLWTNEWVFQTPSTLIVAALALFWAPVLVWYRLPSERAARRRLDDEHSPSLVLVLKRFPDGAPRAGIRGVRLRPPGDDRPRR